jgi:hypothetical protein
VPFVSGTFPGSAKWFPTHFLTPFAFCGLAWLRVERGCDAEREFRAKDLSASNMIQFVVGELTGTVWIADIRVSRAAKQAPSPCRLQICDHPHVRKLKADRLRVSFKLSRACEEIIEFLRSH